MYLTSFETFAYSPAVLSPSYKELTFYSLLYIAYLVISVIVLYNHWNNMFVITIFYIIGSSIYCLLGLLGILIAYCWLGFDDPRRNYVLGCYSGMVHTVIGAIGIIYGTGLLIWFPWTISIITKVWPFSWVVCVCVLHTGLLFLGISLVRKSCKNAIRGMRTTPNDLEHD